jgi:murein DD-endopeptidase MepM/ murein hydrolase activator NlpD
MIAFLRWVQISDRRSAARFAALAAASLSLAACGWAEWPPRDSRSRVSLPPPQPGPIVAPAAETGDGPDTTIAGRGDTVYGLARRYRISVRTIIEANYLPPPYHLTVGQRIVLPRARGYVVEKGETLESIAQRHGVSTYDLARANRIEPTHAVRAGERLTIPRGGVTPSPVAAGPSRVVSGEAVTSEELAPPPKAAIATPRQPEGALAAAPASPPPAGEPPATSPTEPAATVAAMARPAVPVASAAGKGFQWPVRGKVISTFGSKAKGLRNDGINIAAPHGAPVRAAEGGVVAYAGNELRGFGNLLLIKHADGWVTAYAHNDVLLVKRGEAVAKGQIIARVGNSGSVATPQLHFEIRQGKRAVDPQLHLGNV